jgi:hypothetical protein
MVNRSNCCREEEEENNQTKIECLGFTTHTRRMKAENSVLQLLHFEAASSGT